MPTFGASETNPINFVKIYIFEVIATLRSFNIRLPNRGVFWILILWVMSLLIRFLFSTSNSIPTVYTKLWVLIAYFSKLRVLTTEGPRLTRILGLGKNRVT